MFEAGLIVMGAALALMAISIVAGLIIALTKDEDAGAITGIGGYIFFWGVAVVGAGIAIIGAVLKFLQKGRHMSKFTAYSLIALLAVGNLIDIPWIPILQA